MCRNRTEQINHIQKNLIVYIHRKDKTDNYIPVGTGFFVSNDGTIMTAKHNIDFSLKCSFWALYQGKYYEIHKKKNVNYQYDGVDIVVVQIDIQLNMKQVDFFDEYVLSENSLISEEVVVIAYENKGNGLLCTTGTICGVTGGRYEIQNANVGSGNSGAPVILRKDLRTVVGVMSKREGLLLDLTNYKIKSEKFGIGYAHSINLFNEKCAIDISSINHKVCNILNTMELNKWEEFFYNRIKIISEQYRKRPDPIYIYNKYFKNDKIESICLEQFCEFMINNKLFLYSMGKMLELIGNILVNSGILIVLPNARHYLEMSNTIYKNLSFCIDEVIRRRIKVNWLISITYKLERNYGVAVEICEDTTKKFKNECEKFQISYDSGLILLERELAVIEQQKGYFRVLKDKGYLYENNRLETFFTNRRIFEFFLSKSNTVEAKRIFPDLMKSFQQCKYQLEPIYKFTLAKNLYQYNALLNRPQKAEKYFDYAFKNFEYWGLKGQLDAILKIQDNLSV